MGGAGLNKMKYAQDNVHKCTLSCALDEKRTDYIVYQKKYVVMKCIHP